MSAANSIAVGQPGPPPKSVGSKLIFVVDDDAMMAWLVATTMESVGYEVKVFASGMAAVAAAETQPPDVLLVDFNMPQLNGADTMARMRKMLPGLPVVVISGLPGAEVRAAAPAADCVVEKPFAFDVLLREVSRLVAKKRVSDAPLM